MSNNFKISKRRLAEIIQEEYASIREEIDSTEMVEKKEKFPDLTGDGEVTRADILKGRGVKLDGEEGAEASDDDKEESDSSDDKESTKKESVQSIRDLIRKELERL